MNDFPDQWPMNSDWSALLESEFHQNYFQELSQFVLRERESRTVYPPTADVFNAFCRTGFANTKVVILGQDPYHGPGQAHGLSFSVQSDCRLPPSLRNIFKELVRDQDLAMPQTGDLSSWADQGVLLLNTVLTVRQGEPNSHRKQGWERFTDQVIQLLGRSQNQSIVFLLWGKPAEKKSKLISNHHTVIASPHPSPLSAHRGFFGSRPFSRTNEALAESGLAPIRWETVAPSSSI